MGWIKDEINGGHGENMGWRDVIGKCVISMQQYNNKKEGFPLQVCLKDA